MFFEKFRQKCKEKRRHLRRVENIKKLSIDNDVDVAVEDLAFVRIKISGKNNFVKIGKLSSNACGKISIKISGDNNKLIIEPGLYVARNLGILIGGGEHPNFGFVHNCSCVIGKNVGMEQVNVFTYNSNSSIVIGDGCMFAFGITLYHTDGHPILDYQTKKIINKVGEMNIGNHVWVGACATLLKNTKIPDNSIVGWGSVVSGKFDVDAGKGGVVLAGNPARIVKTGVDWDACGANGYVQNEI